MKTAMTWFAWLIGIAIVISIAPMVAMGIISAIPTWVWIVLIATIGFVIYAKLTKPKHRKHYRHDHYYHD